MNLAEFIPFLGDFLPVYTASTIIWIFRESGHDGLFIAKRLLRILSTQNHLWGVFFGSSNIGKPHLN